MKIRNRITLYFSLTTLVLSGIVFLLIYYLFSANREEEFQMRQKQKIQITLELLSKIKQTDDELVEDLDMLTIHDLYDEKLLLFNSNKQLIYSSLDDIPIPFSKNILEQLTPENKWVETKEGKYDIIGTFVENNEKIFYGISKAYDKYGYSKLHYLGYILIGAFIVIVIVTISISFYLSKKITEPLATVTKKISDYNPDASEYVPIEFSGSKDEVSVLAQQFNKLMKRMNEVFSFQKHAVHHISHELKTPISILVSNFERIENEKDVTKIASFIKTQKEETKSLSEVINALLEIAKTDSGTVLKRDLVRVDELIFDVAEELKNIYPDFQFFIDYDVRTQNEAHLELKANARLIKSVLLNLMQNAINYGNENKANIRIETTEGRIQLVFENKGIPISDEENPFLFQHFFRGQNSRGKRGFGLGLVLVHKIVALHNGTTSYQFHNQLNTFIIQLPLS